MSEAMSIRRAITIAVAKHRPASLVIGGDMNLVASKLPLTILREDGQSMLGETHRGDLMVAAARHLDDGATYTWHDPGSQFMPGQLDFILTGGKAFQAGSFIYDTSDLSGDESGTQREGTTAEASDHLPVVVDLLIEQD